MNRKAILADLLKSANQISNLNIERETKLFLFGKIKNGIILENGIENWNDLIFDCKVDLTKVLCEIYNLNSFENKMENFGNCLAVLKNYRNEIPEKLWSNWINFPISKLESLLKDEK